MNTFNEKQLSILPATSKKHYLTGVTALNIPSPDGTSGDWHFHETFYGRGEIKPKFMLAGEGEELNTNFILQDFGIYECSGTLRHLGVAVDNKVYAANHHRAILDMLYRSVKLLRKSPTHIKIDDWLDTEEQKKLLLNKIKDLEPYMEKDEWQMIQTWLLEQT